MEINISQININEIIQFCFDILESLLICNRNKFENVTSKLKIPEDIKKLNIEADEIRLKKILLNFISNAEKFTKKGKIVLKCEKFR